MSLDRDAARRAGRRADPGRGRHAGRRARRAPSASGSTRCWPRGRTSRRRWQGWRPRPPGCPPPRRSPRCRSAIPPAGRRSRGAVVAAYFMNPEVCERIGYAGPAGDPARPGRAADYLEDGLLDSVKAAGAGVSSDPLTFRVADPDERYAAVRLCSDLPLSDARAQLRARRRRVGARARRRRRSTGSSTSSSSSTPDGATETVSDPGNPHPGARRVRREVGRCWRPATSRRRGSPRTASRGASTRSRSRGARPRRERRGTDLEPGRRRARPAAAAARRPRRAGVRRARRAHAVRGGDDRRRARCRRTASRCSRPATATSGTRRRRCYARALYVDVVPGAARRGRRRRRAGRHGREPRRARDARTQRRAPRTFGGLFLQSGSFFMPRYDAHESGFPRYARIVRFVRADPARGAGATRSRSTMTCGVAEENLDNNRADGARARRAGLRRRARRGTRRAQLHRLARRARPAPDAPARPGVGMSGRHAELHSPAIGAAGTVVVYGHYGRPVLVFPSEGGSAWDFENNGMVDAVGELLEAGRVKLVLRRLVRRRRRGRTAAPARGARPPARAATSRGSSTRSCRSSTTTSAARRRSSPPAASMGAFHAVELRAQARRPVPARDLPVRQLRPVPGRWGDAATPRTSTTRWLRRHLTATTSTGCARGVSLLLVCGQGSGRTRPGRSRAPSGSRGCSARRASGTSSTSGGTTSRTTGRRGARSSRTICPGSADGRRDDHLIGLLLGTEEDWPRAFETLSRRLGPIKDASGTTHHVDASGSPSSRSTCATSRATSSSSTGSRTGTTSRASG